METSVLEPVIYIVDDDPAVGRALARLVESVGLRVEVFGTPEEFLKTGAARPVGCLLLDIHFPGMNGFELHDRLVGAGMHVPVIFITAHPDIRAQAKARQKDAVAFLEKPFDDRTLFDALEIALDRVVGGESDQSPL